MVAVIELDRLYFHFKSLLFSGFKASVTLTAGLGQVNNCKVVKKKRSPSYFKRLEKRKNDRNKLSSVVADTEDEVTAEKVATSEMEDAAAGVPEQVVVDKQNGGNEAEQAMQLPIDANYMESTENVVTDVNADAVAPAEKAAIENAEDAEKQPMKRKKWLYCEHGCVIEWRSTETCNCCTNDSCQGYIYYLQQR